MFGTEKVMVGVQEIQLELFKLCDCGALASHNSNHCDGCQDVVNTIAEEIAKANRKLQNYYGKTQVQTALELS